MNIGIEEYNSQLFGVDRDICIRLQEAIGRNLPDAEGKVWHGSPVWFLAGNPIVGYSKLKSGIQLLFWSGASFDENLKPFGKHKAAEIRYTDMNQIDIGDLDRWLGKSRDIQWDYQGIVQRQGVLV
jgi:hypothetical protein